MDAAFIAGSAFKGTSGHSGEVINPANGEVVESFEYAGPAEVDAAVRAARSAFGEWSGAAPVERNARINVAGHLVDLTLSGGGTHANWCEARSQTSVHHGQKTD